MLGSECPRCGRRNAVGERDRCLYCGAAVGDGSEVAAPPAASPLTDPDDVVIGPLDHLKAFARSWPGMVTMFVVVFAAGLFGYWRAMAHYAPAFGGGTSAPRDAPRKPRWMAKRDAEAALEAVAELVASHAERSGHLPPTLSPDLAELGVASDVDSLLAAFDRGRIEEYRVSPAPDGRGETYLLTARSAEHGDLVAVKGRHAPGD